MKSFIISTAAALFLTLASAAPALIPRGDPGFLAVILFEGATPDANFTMDVPTDNSNFEIGKSYLHLVHSYFDTLLLQQLTDLNP
jgi:hypothetical protein